MLFRYIIYPGIQNKKATCTKFVDFVNILSQRLVTSVVEPVI